MNFRRTTWGVGLLGSLALLGCVGDDTPTPEGPGAGLVAPTGAGGAGNDASTGSDTSTGKAGAGGSDSGAQMCKVTAGPTGVTNQDIGTCNAALEAGVDDSGAGGSEACLACLCFKCPYEAKNCIGNPNCPAVTTCCRALCPSCPSAAPEGGSDAPASDAPLSSGDGAGETSTTDGAAE